MGFFITNNLHIKNVKKKTKHYDTYWELKTPLV